MGAIAYASGRYAWGECQKCGLRFKYLQLRSDGHWRHLRVCPDCYDPRHPQERLLRVSDAVALWRPSPESRHAPTIPVLAGETAGTTNSLSWTAVTSQDSRVAGYRLYRDEVQIADLEIETDYTGAVLVDPRAYDDESLADGTYEYTVVAYDLRGLVSGPSNVVTLTVASEVGLSFDVTLGEIESASIGYGYEVQGFASGNPPLTGEIDPDPPVVGDTIILAIWAWESLGFELWFEGPLPSAYSTLRIVADGGTVELNLNAPDDFIDDPGQSWLYYLDSGIWQASELGQVRRITFLE